MDKKLLLFVIICIFAQKSQSDDQIYETNICEKCNCTGSSTDPNSNQFILNCNTKGLSHLLSEWPQSFGTDLTPDNIIIVGFSGNEINRLQPLPATIATIFFSCRHCNLTEIISGSFIDVPNIVRLDLSWNELTGDNFQSSTFRGRFDDIVYAPTALEFIDLSHNKIETLDANTFEHTPYLTTLSLVYNPITTMDGNTISAIGSVKSMEHLDLSYIGISELSDDLLKNMPKLRELLIHGNKFTKTPESLSSVGKSLTSLYIGDNPIIKFDEESFLGLKVLTHLNISDMAELEEISEGTFDNLNLLQVLICENNKKLSKFNLPNFKNLTFLRELDIANGSISAIDIGPIKKTVVDDVEHLDETDDTANKHLPTNLRTLKLQGNPWHCDCNLFKTLQDVEFFEEHFQPDARCATPYEFSGFLIKNLTLKLACSTSMAYHKAPVAPIYEPPRFLRPRSILLSILSVIAVVIIGLVVGFGIILIKRKLRKNDIGFAAPVRYTTVRNSTVPTSIEA